MLKRFRLQMCRLLHPLCWRAAPHPGLATAPRPHLLLRVGGHLAQRVHGAQAGAQHVVVAVHLLLDCSTCRGTAAAAGGSGSALTLRASKPHPRASSGGQKGRVPAAQGAPASALTLAVSVPCSGSTRRSSALVTYGCAAQGLGARRQPQTRSGQAWAGRAGRAPAAGANGRALAVLAVRINCGAPRRSAGAPGPAPWPPAWRGWGGRWS